MTEFIKRAYYSRKSDKAPGYWRECTNDQQKMLAHERERCAKVCEQLAGDSIGKTFAAAIRSLK